MFPFFFEILRSTNTTVQKIHIETSNMSKDINMPSGYQVYEVPPENNDRNPDVLGTDPGDSTTNTYISGEGYQAIRSGEEKIKVSRVYKPNRIREMIQEYWLLEVASLVVSLIALAMIAVVLEAYDQKALLEWPLHITLNTFIPFFATISKATLVLPGVLLFVSTIFRFNQ